LLLIEKFQDVSELAEKRARQHMERGRLARIGMRSH
jgi:hypothetical protein